MLLIKIVEEITLKLNIDLVRENSRPIDRRRIRLEDQVVVFLKHLSDRIGLVGFRAH